MSPEENNATMSWRSPAGVEAATLVFSWHMARPVAQNCHSHIFIDLDS